MIIEKKSISFSVNGDFITEFAREQFYDGKAKHAMELLLLCMEGTDASEHELRERVFSILDGYAELTGTYPGNDYRYRYLDKKDDRWDILEYIEKLISEKQQIQKELDNITRRYCIAMDKLSDQQQREVRIEMGEKVPDDLEAPMSDMLFSYLKRWHDSDEHSTGDYGWLEPNGTFHEVEWGNHQEWAQEYINKNLSDKITAIDNEFGDLLVERGWVLLHNPSQGIAFPTKDPSKRYTKAQKEFLYDYYTERGCKEEANAIFREE
jgi:hypothetical protein